MPKPTALQQILDTAGQVRARQRQAVANAGTLLAGPDATDPYREVRRTWQISICAPGNSYTAEPVDLAAWTRCTVTTISRDLRDPDSGGGQLEYRGACLGCGWVSDDIHHGENAAVEDAHDHAHPGWRSLPIVEAPPDGTSGERTGGWVARNKHLLPDGWLEQGGPIRTRRGQYTTRHVPGRAPGGGYDLSHTFDTGPQDTPAEEAGGVLLLF